MALETAQFISQLVPANPLSTDQKREGDDHIRMLKAVLQATFPKATGPQATGTAEVDEMYNRLKGLKGAGYNGTWASTGLKHWGSKDLNSIVDAGWYWYDGSTGNRPSGQGFLLSLSLAGDNANPAAGAGVTAQIAFKDLNGSNREEGIATRFNYGSGWSAWTSLQLDGYYVNRGGSQMWGSLESSTGGGAYSFRVVGDKGMSWDDWKGNGTPALQMDTPNGNAAYMIWRATRWGGQHLAMCAVIENGYGGSPDISWSIGGNNRTHVFTRDGNIYTTKYGYLDSWANQFAHANTDFVPDLVWTGNSFNINLSANWGRGFYIIRAANNGDWGGVITTGQGTNTGDIASLNVNVGDIFNSLQGWQANAIWKMRKT